MNRHYPRRENPPALRFPCFPTPVIGHASPLAHPGQPRQLVIGLSYDVELVYERRDLKPFYASSKPGYAWICNFSVAANLYEGFTSHRFARTPSSFGREEPDAVQGVEEPRLKGCKRVSVVVAFLLQVEEKFEVVFSHPPKLKGVAAYAGSLSPSLHSFRGGQVEG